MLKAAFSRIAIQILSKQENRGKKRKRESSPQVVQVSEIAEPRYCLRSRQTNGTGRSIELPKTNDYELRSRRKKIKPNSCSSSDSESIISSETGIERHQPEQFSSITSDPIDSSISFEAIGGLHEHIECLKEMIVLPTLYPEVFRKYNVEAPRGILFYGPPGTGKTLMAKAVANECNIGSRKVTFFMRKGSDLLSEWIGESERKLRHLFEQASVAKPSIIFFDEIDGLAPVRSSRQDYVHASMVSTLLALMDGIEARGEVIVIGATNRIDAIDPALRRPGRFDRELLFTLPARDEREKILRVHTSKWQKQLSNETLLWLSEKTTGYCGSDLKSLCTESVIRCLRRNYPEVYSSSARLDIDLAKVCVEQCDFECALSLIVPAQKRIEPQLARKMPDFLKPFYAKANAELKTRLNSCFPHSTQLQLSKVKISDRRQQARLLVCADSDEQGHTIHLAANLLFDMEHLNVFQIDLERLKRHSSTNTIEAFVQIFRRAQTSVPSVIFLPEIDRFWTLIDDTLKTVIISKFVSLDTNVPILLLATANVTIDQLPSTITTLFSNTRHEIYELPEPDAQIRRDFFAQLFLHVNAIDPVSDRKRNNSRKSPELLPRPSKNPNCSVNKFLEDSVQLTKTYSVQLLIDLFNRFSEIVRKPHFNSLELLVKELRTELSNFNSLLLVNITNIENKLKICPPSVDNCSKTYFS